MHAVWHANQSREFELSLHGQRGGRAPAMKAWPWQVDCGVEVGATSIDAWYWRHPLTGCRWWCGPYPTRQDAKEGGMFHRIHCDVTS